MFMRGEQMRAVGCFLLGVVAAILVIAYGLFAMENGQTVPFSFLGNSMRMSVWLLVAAPVGEMSSATTPVRETAAQDSTVYSETPAMVQREEPVVPVAPAASDRVAAPAARDGAAEQQPGTRDEAVQAEPPARPTL